ncbi:PA2169 family four-helix-bundle protein [Mesonia sp. K7]|uniref:ferritin-like domain-containing protein n=1 Tax=Mesonia sp. K7 TaxID=2218606 RepID=UPI000DA8EFD6|nr:PA2169 family four-helix-bundle protein [Mesonia sp. K7]PZD78667.1 hypothetical protein DNG35_04230 [Mesonia sp. K7]
METRKEIANKLNEILERTYDAEKGYKDAAERVDNAKMKSFLNEQAQQRYDFGHELKSEIKNFGETPEKGGSVKGAIHRNWMDLKAAISSNSEERVMEEVQRGEQAALDEYDSVMENINILPSSTLQILQKQRESISQAQQNARNWEIIS